MLGLSIILRSGQLPKRIRNKVHYLTQSGNKLDEVNIGFIMVGLDLYKRRRVAKIIEYGVIVICLGGAQDESQTQSYASDKFN